MKYQGNKHLMGTDIEIIIITDKDPKQDLENTFTIFYELEKEFSRFLATSSLSILNKKRKRIVSDRFIEIVQKTKELHQQTHGYFNPLINIAQKGYSRSFNLGNFQKESGISNMDIEKIAITGNTITLGKDQQLDLGGIVKGFAVDATATYLKNQGYHNFIVNAGGDIYVAGNAGEDTPRIIGIDNPFDRTKTIASLQLQDISISTSGRYKRKWKIGNKEYHHILNPLDDTNKTEIISISIIHPECTLSDAYATACFNMGIKDSLTFLAQHNAEGIIISATGKIYTTPGIKKLNLFIY